MVDIAYVTGGETEDEGARPERGGVDEQHALWHASREDTGGWETSGMQDWGDRGVFCACVRVCLCVRENSQWIL